MWKWALSKFKLQKDIFTKEEKLEIYNMMKKEWNIYIVFILKYKSKRKSKNSSF